MSHRKRLTYLNIYCSHFWYCNLSFVLTIAFEEKNVEKKGKLGWLLSTNS